MNDDDHDILYSDLSENTTSDDIKKLQTELETLQERNKKLELALLNSEKEQKKLSHINKVLQKNISSLYKTARSEVERKENMLNELRAEFDNMAFRRRNYHNRHKYNTYRSRNEERYRDHETEDNFPYRYRNRDDKKCRSEEKYHNPEPNYEKSKPTQAKRRNQEIEPKRVDPISNQPEKPDRVPIKNERTTPDVLINHNHETNKIEVKRAENLAHVRNCERNHETEDIFSVRHRNRNDKKHRYEEKYHNPEPNHEKNKPTQAKRRNQEIEPKRVDPISNQPEKPDRVPLKNERITFDIPVHHNHETKKVEVKRGENLVHLGNIERSHETKDNFLERHCNRSDDKYRYEEKHHSPEFNHEKTKPTQARRRNPEIKPKRVDPITNQPEKPDQVPVKNETTPEIPVNNNHEINKVEVKPPENSVHVENRELNLETKDNFPERRRNRSDDKYRYEEKYSNPEPNHEKIKPTQSKRRNPEVKSNRVDSITNQSEKSDQVPIQNERTTDIPVNHNHEIDKVEVKPAENLVHLEKCDQLPYDTPRKLINGELIGFPFKYPLKLITPLRDTPDCLKEKLNALRNNDICPVVPMLNEHRMLDNHETMDINPSSSFSVLSVNDAEHGAFSRKGRKRPVVQTRVINVKKVCASS